MLFLIALLVLGPQRLPQVARMLGRGLAEVRKYRAMLQTEVSGFLEEPKAVIDNALSGVHDVRSEVRSASSELRSASQRLVTLDGGPEAELEPQLPAPGRAAPEPIVSPAPDDPTLN